MNNKVLLVMIIILFIGAAYFYSGGDIHFGGIKPVAQTIEHGEFLPKATDYYAKSNYKTTITYTLDGEEVENPSTVGEYKVTLTLDDDRTLETTLTIKDTKGPVLKLKDLKIKYGSTYTIEDFIDKDGTYDLSGVVEYAYTNETFANFTAKGTYKDIGIKATDKYKNITIEYTTLTIE